MVSRRRSLGLSLAISLLLVPLLPASAFAHTPTNTACYWSGTLTTTRSLYWVYEDPNYYSRITSRVDYAIGYTCSGQPILTKVLYRAATYSIAGTYATDDHNFATYYALHDSYTGDHVTTNGFWNPNRTFTGNGSWTVSTGTDVLMEYHYDCNQIYIFGNSLDHNEGSRLATHRFLRGSIAGSIYCNY
jgi:hypothetical protein